MGKLLLNSLEIRNFRAFRHLKIKKVGRVNLIVGKNNVGKSSLLEALWLYARRGSPATIRDILEARDESRLPISAETDTESRALAIKYLFHGRKEIGRQSETIYIGPINSPNTTLSITLMWHEQQIGEDGIIRLLPIRVDDFDEIDNPVLGVVSRFGSETVTTRRLTRYFERRAVQSTELNEIPCIFIPANGPSKNQIAFWRDRSVIEGRENYVIQALGIIAGDVESINLVSSQDAGRSISSADRVPVVKLRGTDNFIPLRSLGEGMNRLFALALALVNAQNGILLLDEVESGLHYSVLADVWQLILQIAQALNVQVFASTHSKDCINAFNEATKKDRNEEGFLIRLGRKQGDIITTIFDEDELEIATEQNVEVR